MEEVFRTGELHGYIMFFYGNDWLEQAKVWEKKHNVVMGEYYKQVIGNGVIVSYSHKKKVEVKDEDV